jgi:hypothetical protein
MKLTSFFTPLTILNMLTTTVGVVVPMPVSAAPFTSDKPTITRDGIILEKLAVIQFYEESECTLPLPHRFPLTSLDTCYPVLGKTLEVLETSEELKYNSCKRMIHFGFSSHRGDTRTRGCSRKGRKNNTGANIV